MLSPNPLNWESALQSLSPIYHMNQVARIFKFIFILLNVHLVHENHGKSTRIKIRKKKWVSDMTLFADYCVTLGNFSSIS